MAQPGACAVECFVVIDDGYAAAYRFRDEPRVEGASFIKHPRHGFDRVMIGWGIVSPRCGTSRSESVSAKSMPRRRRKRK
jgi:hypothetical protein